MLLQNTTYLIYKGVAIWSGKPDEISTESEAPGK